jgi:death-on-curing protein
VSEIHHPATQDVLDIHEVIVEQSEPTSAGVSNQGNVEYAVEFVREGHFDSGPTTLHQKAFHLLRLLVANHPFVDGNKRTALATAVLFYAMNDIDFVYDREMKSILNAFATDVTAVEKSRVLEYLQDHTEPLDEDLDAILEVLFEA